MVWEGGDLVYHLTLALPKCFQLPYLRHIFIIKMYGSLQLIIISPDESQGYIGFTSVALLPPPYFLLVCVISQKRFHGFRSNLAHTHVFGPGEVPYYKVTLNSQ